MISQANKITKKRQHLDSVGKKKEKPTSLPHPKWERKTMKSGGGVSG